MIAELEPTKGHREADFLGILYFLLLEWPVKNGSGMALTAGELEAFFRFN